VPDRVGRSSLDELLRDYEPSENEAGDVLRLRRLVAGGSAWDRRAPLHVTASALIVHPPSGRVLLRWHARQQAWLQIGGHADPGESDPLFVALREGEEETGLTDLEPWPDAALRHVVVVPVPANDRESAHEHGDLRFVLATEQPEAARPERPTDSLRWLSIPDALELTSEENVRETIRRAATDLRGG
jgi:8-oxo-dGTP pyrophosphatase MutT (NUDIX family)